MTFLSFRPQTLSLSQQVFAAVPRNELTGKEANLQWKNLGNRPWYIYKPGVFNQGSMGRECQNVYSRLAQLIFEKRDLRGLRTVCRDTAEFEIDVDVSHTVAKM